MAAVLTICPITQQLIATGIETDELSLALSPAFVAHLFCPHCKRDHEWSKETAWLDAGGGELVRPK